MRKPLGCFPDVPCRGYIHIATCFEHKLEGTAVQSAIDENWDMFMNGFDRANQTRPKKSRTTWDYCDWSEVEAFFRETASMPHMDIYKN